MPVEWVEIPERSETFHARFPNGNLALSHEPDGWYWGAFSYETGLRISEPPKPYVTRDAAQRAAEAWHEEHVTHAR